MVGPFDEGGVYVGSEWLGMGDKVGANGVVPGEDVGQHATRRVRRNEGLLDAYDRLASALGAIDAIGPQDGSPLADGRRRVEEARAILRKIIEGELVPQVTQRDLGPFPPTTPPGWIDTTWTGPTRGGVTRVSDFPPTPPVTCEE